MTIIYNPDGSSETEDAHALGIARAPLSLTMEQVWALAEVVGRVTPRQLRGMGLEARDRADLDAAHDALVSALAADAKRAERDPRQLVLHLHPAAPEQYAGNARGFAKAGRYADAMTAMGRAFPSLHAADPPGLSPWNAETFALYAAPSGPVWAAQMFLLDLWGSTPDAPPAPRFEALLAVLAWDDAHRSAFIEWLRAPWWPIGPR